MKDKIVTISGTNVVTKVKVGDHTFVVKGKFKLEGKNEN